MDEINDLAFKAFGTKKAADFWLKNPNPELDDKTPLQIIQDGKLEIIKDFLKSLIEGDL
jgi:uncharacterized protein (DUF2384 family)